MKQESRPWNPPKSDLADIAAIQAVDKGVASPEQQRRAMTWIIEKASMYYDLSFCPGGEDGRRDSDFAEGRRFVGAEIVTLTKLNLAKLKQGKNSDVHEPKE